MQGSSKIGEKDNKKNDSSTENLAENAQENKLYRDIEQSADR